MLSAQDMVINSMKVTKNQASILNMQQQTVSDLEPSIKSPEYQKQYRISDSKSKCNITITDTNNKQHTEDESSGQKSTNKPPHIPSLKAKIQQASLQGIGSQATAASAGGSTTINNLSQSKTNATMVSGGAHNQGQ
jgi:hypothetical protein